MKKYLIILFTLIASQLKAQNVLHGRVLADSTGNPLYGATVRIRESGLIAISDSSGYFNLNVPQAKVTLLVSFSGYATTKLPLATPFAKVITVRLLPDVRSLQEVAISTGYQNLPRDRATGSFNQVDNKLYNRRVSSDALSRLEGVVPGLLFNRNTSASAGGAADLSIRGTSTLFAANQPLIVVDGFPYDGNIANIDPNVIENISVLKDAAAASIWGVKSGNGVIVITTKQGSRNKKLTIDFNSNVTVGERPDIYYSPAFLNANDFINVEEKLFSHGFYDSNLSTPFTIVSPVVALLAKERSGLVSPADADSQISVLRGMDVRRDLSEYFYRHSVDQQYALSISGGGANSDYFLSGSYDNDLSSQVGNSNRRVTLNSAFNFYPVKNLKVSAGLNIAHNLAVNNSPLANINGGGGYGLYPYAQLVSKNGMALPIVKDYASAYTDTAGGGKFLDWKYRPLDELHADNTSSSLDNRINLGLKYNFLSGFAAEAKYEYENQKGSQNNDYSQQTYYARNLINEFTSVDGFGNLTYPVPQGGILQTANDQLTVHRGRIQLDFNKDWKLHQLSVIAGTEINQTVSASNSNSVYGYDKNTLTFQNVDFVGYYPRNPDGSTAQIPNTLSLGEFTDRYVSYYSNAGYTYNGKYTLSLSGRIDRSNLFGVNANQKSVPLFSTGFSWEFSKEDFYDLSWLPYGKLRVTYGYNGNTDKRVAALTTFQQFSGAPYTGNPYAVIVSPGDPELRWERDRVINFGLDFSSKNHVVSGTFEYYLKNGLDLIGDSPLAPSTGFSAFRGNTANIKGHGLDLNLNANILNGTNFKWQSNFLLSYVLDKITKYDAQLDVTGYLEVGDGNAGTIYPLTGRPLYAIYSYKWAGMTHDTGDPQGYLNGAPSTDYASIISGTTTAGMTFNGPSRPTTFGSFRNTFTWRHLTASANIIYKLNYFFRRTSINYASLFNSWTGNKDFDQRWQQRGDEAKTNVPSMPSVPLDQNRETFYQFSSALVDRGDHIRLQDISISYDLVDAAGRTRSPFRRLQVYSYINNVGIIWRANHNGLDPDLFTGALPLPRTISFGIKATF